MTKTILFVDDEVSILKAIKREFFDAKFEIITANSAKEALELIEKNKIDIIVSDVKMPDTDGIELLKLVKEQHPHINRVILSGYVEEETVFVAILQGIATTYFVKPWKPEVLRKKLEHILQMQELFKNKRLLQTLNSIRKLPVLPKVYSDLLDVIGRKKSNKEIARIICKDISISTKILQIVNSAFYGIKTVSSIERGLALLGLNNIKDMVLTLTIVSELNWSNDQRMILENIIYNSSLINNVFKILYKKKFDQILKAEFSSIGITHNIGKIILLQYFYDDYKKIMNYNKEHPDKSFFNCEFEINADNVPHTQIGAYILNLWNLHSINIETALFHHEPEKSSEGNRQIIEIFSLAVSLVEFVNKHIDQGSIEYVQYADKNFSLDDINEVAEVIIESNKNR